MLNDSYQQEGGQPGFAFLSQCCLESFVLNERSRALRQVVPLNDHSLRIDPIETGGELQKLGVNIRTAHAVEQTSRVEDVECLGG